jgi:hypothetical protein
MLYVPKPEGGHGPPEKRKGPRGWILVGLAVLGWLVIVVIALFIHPVWTYLTVH